MKQELPQVDDYASILLNDAALLDVRAPVEFCQGSFPGAKNIPLIDDEEREKIGICYKNRGQDEAIRLGHKLVSGEKRTQRIDGWSQFVENHPDGYLYCFRGGMRSKISQQWIYEQTGVLYPRIKGGYKAMRRFLIDELTKSMDDIQPVLLGGRTGIGKTLLLKELKQQIDLEGIYHHRGSVFGKHVTAQPPQIDVENRLSIELMKLRRDRVNNIVMEDEGSRIGSRSIPDVVTETTRCSPLIILEAGIDERVDITYDEYIDASLDEHVACYGEDRGYEAWSQQLQESIDRIKKRLGGVRYQQLKEILLSALDQQRSTGDKSRHKEWIRPLLVDYYDPMYDFQIGRKQAQIVFKGDKRAVVDYLAEQFGIV